MADRVRKLMEGMVPEFEDLVRRELCSEHEVKQLVRRREKAEYLLHRREPTREGLFESRSAISFLSSRMSSVMTSARCRV